MTINPDLQARARAWIDDDPEPTDRAELQRLLDAGDSRELESRLGDRLRFGTAGLRGAMGAGPARMNRATVAAATAGLCAHLREAVPEATTRGLCIGFDGRHRSPELAEETAAVAAAAGFVVHGFDTPVPTPLLAYAVLARRAAAGVMITASHNPAPDNGYKLYWHNGAQIIPPVDGAIADAIDAIDSIKALPRMSLAQRRERHLQHDLGAPLEQQYLRSVAALHGSKPVEGAADLTIAYTAMHGVGQHLVEAAMAQAGFTRLHSVPEQAEPDPDFPTVAFPNPEEDGAMDRVLALGEAHGAELVLANDPDADRLAVAVRDRTGVLAPLTGNELGALLADDLLTRFERRGGAGGMVLNSIVSSPLVARIAAAHGAHHEDTLTGFKWVCNRAMQLEEERGLEFVFGFEEALGYAAGTGVRDKDGVSIAVLTARMAAEARQHGETLRDRLERLWQKHGVHLSHQISLRLEGPTGPQQRTAMMRALRESPPRELAGLRVTAIRDLAKGDGGLPPHDAVFLHLEGGQRVALRPSGTEPKVKLYLDVCEPVEGNDVPAAVSRAQRTLEALAAAARERMAPG